MQYSLHAIHSLAYLPSFENKKSVSQGGSGGADPAGSRGSAPAEIQPYMYV